MIMCEGQGEIRCCHVQNTQTEMEEFMVTAPTLNDRRLRQGTKTGDWLTMLPSTVNGMELGSQEWRNSLFLHYVIDTTDLPTLCYGCNAKIFMCNALDCKKSILITNRHNYLRDGVADLTGKAFTPLHVRNNPLIHQRHAVR